MKRVFVYEYLSGGGLLDAGASADADLQAQGLAMRDAVVADLLRTGECTVSTAAGAQLPPAPWPATTVTPGTAEAPIDFVARQAARHDVTWVIAPETDGLLEQFQAVVAPARWLGCDGPAIRLTSSKQATLRRLAERGLATPLAFAQSAGITQWVVKPDDGAGSLATRVHASFAAAREDWARRSRRGAAITLEPWLPGEALSVSLLCSDEGSELLSVNRQHITIDAQGTLAYAGVSVNIYPPSDARTVVLRALAAQVVAALPGLRGFVGIDLVWHAQHGPVVIEVNPRLTCAYAGLSAALGRNLAAEILQLHARAHPSRKWGSGGQPASAGLGSFTRHAADANA
ncbi:ATP-grasp domain-containing protein [Aquabacterium sp.]|uniref:ATP-grasp domain-containing protein n=1 Tax=Aquabacterium sp. TaxID=1872578 RepID=UPI002BE38AD6|nr:ATP-grasp domain-containing protein [Aquabacterium sp.]HSW08761.1 ATP-grasp domain-containing protein [Aquabacterium sp.]